MQALILTSFCAAVCAEAYDPPCRKPIVCGSGDIEKVSAYKPLASEKILENPADHFPTTLPGDYVRGKKRVEHCMTDSPAVSRVPAKWPSGRKAGVWLCGRVTWVKIKEYRKVGEPFGPELREYTGTTVRKYDKDDELPKKGDEIEIDVDGEMITATITFMEEQKGSPWWIVHYNIRYYHYSQNYESVHDFTDMFETGRQCGGYRAMRGDCEEE